MKHSCLPSTEKHTNISYLAKEFNMEKYTTYCYDSQVFRAIKLGAPVEKDNEVRFGVRQVRVEYDGVYQEGDHYYVDGYYATVPTTQQMIGWLREQGFGIDEENYENGIEFTLFKEGDSDYYKTLKIKKEKYRKEAEIELISLALTYLEERA